MIALALLAPSAAACGGFFCNNVPVDQAGEDIVFSVDADKQEVTVHVQIAYEGDAEDFAWIVPVPEAPELVLSSDRMFRELSWRTAPQFQLEHRERDQCEGGINSGGYAEVDGAASSSTPSAEDGVEVVAEQRVGPYETVVLLADTSAELLTWLQNNDYILPDALDPVLAPYVAQGSHFVALRLAKTDSVGQLPPLAMTYPGTALSIPIQLTSIAAADDMRLGVYILGESRAVPESYLHVQVNELAVDWFSWWDPKWEQAITIAANEAGGHAFATDFSGSSGLMDKVLYRPGQYDIPRLAAAADPYAFFDELLTQGFVGEPALLALFRTFLPLPAEAVAAGIDEQSFYNNLSAFSKYVDPIPFDAAAFAAAIDEQIVAPLRLAQTTFYRYPHLTRLTSSVSPEEMTVDPTFVFNADMAQDVPLQHNAVLEYLCGAGGDANTSERRLVLSDGRAYPLPSQQWFWDRGITEHEYLLDNVTTYALVIEATSDSGEPELLFDYRDEAAAEAEALFDELGQRACAGCSSGTASGGAVALLMLLGLARRRRS